MKSNNLLGLQQDELIARVEALGERSFRGKQLYRQLYRRRQLDFDQMTDLGKEFRWTLKQHATLELPRVQKRQDSSDGTVKFLLELEDEKCVEAVYLPEEGRDTLCISSQVGCDVGCTFCLTARMGFVRNLQCSEIVGQVLRVIEQGCLPARGSNLVFMGMGEPLYNYRNVMKAFRILTDPEGMDFSYRKITVSTSGVVPVLEKLAAEKRPPNLAISLNAASDAVRSRIMPINRKWSLAELMRVCRAFPLDARRRITFEYVLLEGENDRDEDAEQLIRQLEGVSAKVNLIPYNPNPGLAHRRPSERRVQNFRQSLTSRGVSTFVRRTRGPDISAACGQLAHFPSGLELTLGDGKKPSVQGVRVPGAAVPPPQC